MIDSSSQDRHLELTAVSGLHLEDNRKTSKDLKAVHKQQIKELYTQIGQLNAQLA